MGCATLPRSRLDSRAGRPVWLYVAVGGEENGVEVSSITKSITAEFFDYVTKKQMLAFLADAPDSAVIAIRSVEHDDPREPTGFRITLMASWRQDA